MSTQFIYLPLALPVTCNGESTVPQFKPVSYIYFLNTCFVSSQGVAVPHTVTAASKHTESEYAISHTFKPTDVHSSRWAKATSYLRFPKRGENTNKFSFTFLYKGKNLYISILSAEMEIN